MMQADELAHKFNNILCSLNTHQEKLMAACKAFERIFSVRPFEVALFGYDSDEAMLSFIWPPELKQAGTIPLNAHNSLVAMTATTKSGSINNSFATTAHLRVFESVRQKGDDLTPIQKIISVPMINKGILIGVIQINRRGETVESTGPDFTDAQLKILSELAIILAAHISS